jgi:hypothetical protein
VSAQPTPRAPALADVRPRAFPPLVKAALAAEILRAYLQVRWHLWRTDLPRTLAAARAGRVEPAARGRRESLVLGTRLGQAVGRTLRLLPTDDRCLLQSLVLTRLLADRGVESALVIGVVVEPELAAHAWVESDDVPLLPTSGSAYARLVRM